MNILAQLKVARNKVAFELGRLDAAISALSGSRSNSVTSIRRPRRKMSIQARKRIAAAQRARWAKWKARNNKAA
jgi:hypothetical protein